MGPPFCCEMCRTPTDSSSDQRRDRLFGPGYVDLLAGDDVGVYEGFDYPHDQASSRPTSPTATTPSSKPYSPTSSTDPWPICPRDASAPTPPGSCARRSPTTCCMPPECSPATNTPGHGDRRYAAGLSPSRPGWPDPSADRSCTCPPTGPGRNIGLHYGTTRLDVRRHSRRHPDHPPTGPTAANRKSWADQQIPHAHNPKNSINKPRHHSTQPIGGSRLRPIPFS